MLLNNQLYLYKNETFAHNDSSRPFSCVIYTYLHNFSIVSLWNNPFYTKHFALPHSTDVLENRDQESTIINFRL